MASPIIARSAGVVPDGPDNTAALNAIIDNVNAAAAPTAIIMPQGRVFTGPLHPITASRVFFVAESNCPDVCRIKQTAPGTLLQWGDATHLPDGGGTVGIGFDGIGDTTSPAIRVTNAARLVFDEVDLVGVGLFALLGADGLTCSQITFKRLHGDVADVPAPVIRAVNGSGVMLHEPDVFNGPAGGAGHAAPGRHFLSIEGGWDTATIDGGLLQLFDAGLNVTVPANKTVTNVKRSGGFIDGCNQGILANVATGGTLSTFEVHDAEVTGFSGRAILVNGPGRLNEIALRDNRILQAKYDGIAVFGAASMVTIDGNAVWGIDQSGVSSAGVNLNGPLDGAVISNNRGGRSMADYGTPGTPTYGVIVSSGDYVAMVGNQIRGSAAHTVIGSLGSNSRGRGNLGLADF